VNNDGRREAKMAENDKPIADWDENCKGVEYCGGAPVSPKQERQDYETRKDVANSLDPHKWKGGGVVDRNAEASRGPNRVEYEVDTDSDDRYRYQESAPEEQQIPFQIRPFEACCRVHLFSLLSLPILEVGSLLKV
jgi:hypothetical protein